MLLERSVVYLSTFSCYNLYSKRDKSLSSLYKLASATIAERLKRVLDKLISDSNVASSKEDFLGNLHG